MGGPAPQPLAPSAQPIQVPPFGGVYQNPFRGSSTTGMQSTKSGTLAGIPSLDDLFANSFPQAGRLPEPTMRSLPVGHGVPILFAPRLPPAQSRELPERVRAEAPVERPFYEESRAEAERVRKQILDQGLIESPPFDQSRIV